jgi:hypothetical protein
MSVEKRQRRPGAGRLIGRPSEGEREVLDALAVRSEELRARLRQHRRDLDDMRRRVAEMEARVPTSRRRLGLRGPARSEVHEVLPSWTTTHEQALATLAAVEHRMTLRRDEAATGTAIAAGEHAIDAFSDAAAAPDWYLDVLERFPNVDPDSVAVIAVAGPSPALDGMARLIRGFHGERIVTDLLVDGQLPSPPGTVDARLVESTYEPGVDVQLITDSGVVEAQVKITQSADMVLRHYDRYPKVPIVYTSTDAADQLEGLGTATGPITVVRPGATWPLTDGPIVVDAGVTSTELGIETMDAMTAGIPDSFIEVLAGELPMFAFGYLALRAGYRWIATDDPNSEIAAAALGAAKDVGVSSGVGSVAKLATGSELVAVPVTLTTALVRSTWKSATGSIRRSTVRADHAARHLRQFGELERA